MLWTGTACLVEVPTSVVEFIQFSIRFNAKKLSESMNYESHKDPLN